VNVAKNFRQWRKTYFGARTISRLLLIWSVFAAGVLLWQTIAYRGIPSAFAEWQFDRFGQYFPVLTLLLLVALFGFPIFYFLFRRHRIRLQSRNVPMEETALLQAHAKVFRNRLAWLAGGFAVAALLPLFFALGQPSGSGKVNPVSVASTAAPAEGATALSGTIRFDRAATLNETLLLMRWQRRFAPVQPASGSLSRLRYFVELRDGETQAPSGAPRQGILERGGLPGELAALYRNAGYEIAEPHYILFASSASMRWPYLAFAGQLGFLALLFGAAAAVQSRRLRKMRDEPRMERELVSA
jgi:hypothetical protein